jgi:hypothetical protein
MADHTELLAEVQRELTAIRIEAERLAGRVRALETIIERYGNDEIYNSTGIGAPKSRRNVSRDPSLN